MTTTPIEVTTTQSALAWDDPLGAYESLCASRGFDDVALLESGAGPAQDMSYSLVAFDEVLRVDVLDKRVVLSGQPTVVAHARFAAGATGDVIELNDVRQVWNVLRAITNSFTAQKTDGFNFGFVSTLTYDAAWATERLPRRLDRDPNRPTMRFSLHSSFIRFDVNEKFTTLVRHECPLFSPAELELIPVDATTEDGIVVDGIETTITKNDYQDRVRKALEYISAGDIYQVQVGHEVRVRSNLAPMGAYRRLREFNPSPYMFILPIGGAVLVGCSPEVHLRMENDRICIRPIAGTTKRGETPEEDKKLIDAMLSDEKEVAEHTMLVDLARNDIGRACVPGSLTVNELMIIESYSHVSHMVSNVYGQKRPDVDLWDVIRATFPAGTVTGTPKVRAMEIIEELENTPRDFYAGAVGVIDVNGYINLALTIRTVSFREGTYTLRASGGVVADSTPENEWNETWRKLGAPFLAVTGKEVDDAGLRG